MPCRLARRLLFRLFQFRFMVVLEDTTADGAQDCVMTRVVAHDSANHRTFQTASRICRAAGQQNYGACARQCDITKNFHTCTSIMWREPSGTAGDRSGRRQLCSRLCFSVFALERAPDAEHENRTCTDDGCNLAAGLKLRTWMAQPEAV